MQRLMLLDAHSLIYRAYFALIETPLSTSKGQLVNAAFGFWSIVLRGLQDIKPDYVMCCFDVGRSFRADTYSEYKATRRPTPDDLRDQFPIVRETLAAFRIPIHELEGYEADDLIGALTLQAEERGDLESVIVSGDLDMLQLVSERTSLMTTRMGVASTVMYDPARIAERYGLEPRQMIDFKALKGDSTDNIPGVAGVGDKTASKWLQDHRSLEGIYANLESIKPDRFRQKLADLRDEVFLWRDLVRIDRQSPIRLDLTDAELGNYDREEVLRLFRQYEFRTLVERIPAIEGEGERAPGELLRQADRQGPVPAALVPGRAPRATAGAATGAQREGLQLSLDFAGGGGAGAPAATLEPAQVVDVGESGVVQALPGQDAAARLSAALRDPQQIESVQRFDGTAAEELTGWLADQSELTVGLALDDPRPRRGTLLGMAVTGLDGRVVTADTEAATQLATAVLAAARPLVGHDVKQLLVWELARRDPTAEHSATESTAAELPRTGFDTQIAAYILNAALRSQGLSDISAERLGLELPKPGELRGPEHAALQSLAVAAARESLARDLGERPALQRILDELELPLIPVLADMEATGVAIDRVALGQLSEEFGREIGRLEEEIFASVGHQFNLGSPKQLEQVLFYELNLPRGRRTKTGYSTDAGVLEELRPAHPMVPLLLDWRLYTKLRSTYVDALPLLLDPQTGRLHTTFQQAVATTGRLSSTDPNLQNIPIRTELGRRIRRAFVAGDPSCTLLAADYSQIELRILAHVSGDVHLREAFDRRADIHRETAARVLGKDASDVTPDERSMAKMVNFGLAYGMSDWGLASRAGIARESAREFIDSYFAAYSGIAYYMIHIKDLAKQQGFVETLLGRRRWIPELEARNSALRGTGERMAINMPIQGTAADIMKIAMIRLHEHLRRVGSRTRMLLSVHDEVVFEVPREELDLLGPAVRDIMEGALKLDVPLDVDLKTGDDWESMTPIPRT
jgi:DNA polymerase I